MSLLSVLLVILDSHRLTRAHALLSCLHVMFEQYGGWEEENSLGAGMLTSEFGATKKKNRSQKFYCFIIQSLKKNNWVLNRRVQTFKKKKLMGTRCAEGSLTSIIGVNGRKKNCFESTYEGQKKLRKKKVCKYQFKIIRSF